MTSLIHRRTWSKKNLCKVWRISGVRNLAGLENLQFRQYGRCTPLRFDFLASLRNGARSHGSTRLQSPRISAYVSVPLRGGCGVSSPNSLWSAVVTGDAFLLM